MYVDSVAHWPRTGVTKISEHIGNWDKDFKIFPNPAEDVVNLRQYGALQQLEVAVLDPNGRLVKNIRMKDMETPINISELSSGMYLIKISHQGQYLNTKKLMVR